MDEQRWKRAKELFHEALDKVAEDRAAFLSRECGDDAELRERVEQLLGSYESGFMQEPAVDSIADAEDRLESGRIVGRYRIIKLIGFGGMGEVYLADDTELNRQVAIKLLRAEVADDKERVRRFIQEAQAASALNHPNILTIHEIGSFEGSRFIVSEFVDGDTLRERMRSGLTVADSVEITYQIAAALKAAHSAGIVHRDIKPENVMIRNDGLVKVLDFGLAKLTEADDRPMDANAPLSRLQTSPGLIMGTVAYMSPEQARGHAVDARTDLWSLGVVLHEMLTGKSPFEGESVTELVSSILSTDSTPANIESLPPELTPICQKALTKEKEKRYQSAHDLLEDLKGEKKRMEYAIETTPFISVSSTDDLKTQLIRPRPTLSTEYIVSSVKRHKYATLLTVGAVLFVGIGLSVYQYNGAPSPVGENGVVPVIDSATTEADLKTSRIPSSGKVVQVAISPDGKYIAYVTSDGPGKQGLRLRELETSSDVEIVPAPSEGFFLDLGFSPDAGQVYYRHALPPFTANTINRVARSGGAPTKLVTDVESGASLSPDGKMLAFSREVERRPGQGGGDAVILANPDGSNERVLSHNGFDAPSWLYCGPIPAWSPDGKSLACRTSFDSPEGGYYRFTTVNVADGSTKLRDEKWWSISGIVSMPDGSYVVVGNPLSAERTAPAQLWMIASNAAPKSLTSDVTGYSKVAATRKGDVLVTIQNRNISDLWSMRVGDSSNPTLITNSGDVDHGGINWTPDGRILFASNITGNREIWIMNADGSGRQQLTRNRNANMSPSMSPDGRYIVFLSDTREWDSHVFRMDADGKNPKQLTNGVSERFPHVSLDGKWVYFTQVLEQGGPSRLCKVSIDGGEPIVLATSKDRIILHDISSNGSIAYTEDSWSGDGKGVRRLKIMSPSDSLIGKTMEFDAATTMGVLRWSADGSYVTYQERKKTGIDVIGGISISGKRLAKPLVTFTYPIRNGSYAWSKDGKRLAYARGTTTSEAILITRRGD